MSTIRIPVNMIDSQKQIMKRRGACFHRKSGPRIVETFKLMSFHFLYVLSAFEIHLVLVTLCFLGVA